MPWLTDGSTWARSQQLIREGARFGVVGLAGVVVTDGGANLLRYRAGMSSFSSVALAVIAATAFAFVASRYWTFRHRPRTGMGRETALFFAVNAVGWAINEGCVGAASLLGWRGGLSYNAALNGGIALATVFRYWSYKRWVWPVPGAARDTPGPGRPGGYPESAVKSTSAVLTVPAVRPGAV
jgi:putative flippase GtrA